MLEKDGIPSREQIISVFPPMERIRRGRVALAECYCRIPCNPCESACPNRAITIGADINERPTVDFDACTGCGLCLSKCPGLAIMLVGMAEEGKTEFSVPYEFLPLPVKGQRVTVTDRAGEALCEGVITRVINPKSYDKTPVVSFTAPEQYLYEARAFRPITEEA